MRLPVQLSIGLLLLAGCSSNEPAPPPPPVAPRPVVRSATPSQPAPPPPSTPAAAPTGRGAPYAIFLNGFSRAEADQVMVALEGHGEFSEVMPGGGTAKRIVLEAKYHGANLRLAMTRILRDLSIRTHFQEAALPKEQLEIVHD